MTDKTRLVVDVETFDVHQRDDQNAYPISNTRSGGSNGVCHYARMRRAAGRDDSILDANDAVRWGLVGLPGLALTIGVLAVRDALDWSWWAGFALAVAAGLVYAIVAALVTRLWRRMRPAGSEPR